MRRLAWAAMASLIAAGAGPVLAQPYGAEPTVIPGFGAPVRAAPRPAAAHGGGYGGGLIEFMMTGQASAPAPRAAPVAAYTASYDPQPAKALDPVFQRQEVAFEGTQSPGTVVIDTSNKFLYLVEAPGRALRYGIGVARPGFLWHGSETITRKAEWPDWTPPAEMMLRRPDLPPHMEGGLANPLGARAMYLGSSLYRIHGTNEPDTIGTNVSSGCIRLTNDDVTDLYNRVRVGTRVVVM